MNRSIEQQASRWVLATVTATRSDGTVDIDTPRGPVTYVRRLKSYTSPVVGDVVKVDINSAGNWVVVGALA
ncbi:hypothetical protein [Streptomyces ardesiacus]|uniref:TRAM domain-containing protein n=1 Tax=Streptomyces ardesiacus TaxID=285564 RepID=A0ABW8HI10_9ACTN|nr:hypothetical protein [Streptomyces sp. NBRC 110030]